MHVPSHADEQHTPSTQKLLAHSEAAWQGKPSTSRIRPSEPPTGTSPSAASPPPIAASEGKLASGLSFSASGGLHAEASRASPANTHARPARTLVSTATDDKTGKTLSPGRRAQTFQFADDLAVADRSLASADALWFPLALPCYKLRVPLRKESKRGLIALAILTAVGLATFAALSTSSPARARAADAIATRLKHAK
jgi:hypothetical protein